MEIPADYLKLKVHDEVVVYRVQVAGASDGGRLVEQQLLAGPADPADLQVTRLTPLPLTVVLRDTGGHEVTVDSEPTADRRQAVTSALVTGLARIALKAERAGVAAALQVPAGLPLGRIRGARRPVKRPPGRSIVNPSARKRTTAAGLNFDSDSQ